MRDYTEDYFNYMVPDDGQEEEKKQFMDAIKGKNVTVLTLGFLFEKEDVDYFGRDNIRQKLVKKTEQAYVELVKELKSTKK